MNYYEHHLGDYMRDTAHLSILEDGVYRRLIDAYYIKEAPLPLNIRECCRLVRAQSKPERQAVEDILNEYFKETPEGWSHKRCNEVIARFQDKQSKAKKSAEARWGASKTESDGNANAYADGMRTHEKSQVSETVETEQSSKKKNKNNPDGEISTSEIKQENSIKSKGGVMRTHCDGNAPNPNNQSHIKPISSVITEGQTNGDEKPQSEHLKTQPTEPAHWVDHFNQHYGTDYGYKTTAQRKHIWPVLTRWCKDGYTVEQVSTAVKRAHEEATEPIVNLILYVDRVLASIQTKKAAPLQWWTTEKGRADKLKELGMSTRPGENNNALVARIQAEIDRRAKG
jgi:uncharacterized protein YdaU (DUF1376 family)